MLGCFLFCNMLSVMMCLVQWEVSVSTVETIKLFSSLKPLKLYIGYCTYFADQSPTGVHCLDENRIFAYYDTTRIVMLVHVVKTQLKTDTNNTLLHTLNAWLLQSYHLQAMANIRNLVRYSSAEKIHTVGTFSATVLDFD